MKFSLSFWVALTTFIVVSTAQASKRCEPPYSYSTVGGEMVRLFPFWPPPFRPQVILAQLTGSPAQPRKALFIEYRDVKKDNGPHSGMKYHRNVRAIWSVNLDEETHLPERLAFEIDGKNPLAGVYQLLVHPQNPNVILVAVSESKGESSLWSFTLSDPQGSLEKLTTFGSYNEYQSQPIELIEDMPGYILLPQSNGYGMKRFPIGKSDNAGSWATSLANSASGSSYVTDFTDLPGSGGLAAYLTGDGQELVVIDLKQPEKTPKSHTLPERFGEIQGVPSRPGTALATAGYSGNVYEFSISRTGLNVRLIGKQRDNRVPQFWHDGRLIHQKSDGVYLQTYDQYLKAIRGN